MPLRRIGTLVSTPLNSVVVLADGPIRSIADLKGRRIGFSVGGFEDVLLKAMLERHGLTLSDVTLINVNFSLSPSIISGQVDAVIGAFRNFELNQMDIVGRPGRAFFIEEEGVPTYDELILVAHADKLSDPRLRRLLDAIEKGTQFLINHPDESWKLFVRGRDELDDELNKTCLARYAAPLRPAPGSARQCSLRPVCKVPGPPRHDQIGGRGVRLRYRARACGVARYWLSLGLRSTQRCRSPSGSGTGTIRYRAYAHRSTWRCRTWAKPCSGTSTPR